MAGQAKIQISVDAQLSGTVDIGTVIHNILYGAGYNFADGSGADQVNKIFTDQRTLTASSTEDLDLAGGLTDALGATITFTKIRGIIVKAAAANTNNVLVGGAATNQFINWVSDSTDKVVVRPGGVFCLIANDATAYAVTAATGDLLRIGNSSSGTSVTYDICIFGA